MTSQEESEQRFRPPSMFYVVVGMTTWIVGTIFFGGVLYEEVQTDHAELEELRAHGSPAVKALEAQIDGLRDLVHEHLRETIPQRGKP